jgi:predicted transport protein
MSQVNEIFGRIANNILASSISASDRKDSGIVLHDRFCNLLFTKHNLKPVQKKLITVFYKDNKNILSIQTQTTSIKIILNVKKGMLLDEKKLFRDVSSVGHWGSGDYQIKLHCDEYFDYVIKLIKANF